MKRTFATLAFLATLAVAGVAQAQFPFALPAGNGLCTQPSGGTCFAISGTTPGLSTSVIAASGNGDSRAIVGSSSSGIGVYGSVDFATGFGVQGLSYFTGTALGAFATGTGVGAVIQAANNTALKVIGSNGVGADFKSLQNDAITITQVGTGHSGLYVAPGNDTWPAYLVGASSTKPGLFVAGVNGGAIRAQGTSGGTNAWLVYSDIELKAKLLTFNGGLKLVERMNPFTYEYKQDEATTKVVGKGAGGKRQLGFSAQELEALGIPGLTERDPGTGKLMASYSPMDAVLVSAIKELAARLAVVEAAVNPTPPINVPGL